MIARLPLRSLAAGLGALALVEPVSAVNRDARPNVVMIVADDMGYSDLGCFGSEIATPNLDALARGGVRFSQFYTTPKCFPSRAAFLTGLYPHQVGMGRSPGHLTGAPTVAQTLRSAGYRTWMTGKWHGKDLPVALGFDRYFGLVDGQVNHFNPGVQRPGEPPPSQDKGQRRWAIDGQAFRPWTPENRDFYSTDAFTDYALRYLDEYNDERPFFLHIAYTAPHYPLQAWPEDIARYRGKYRHGWDAVRADRFARQRELGLLAPGMTALAPRGDTKFAVVRDTSEWLPRFWGDDGRILPWEQVPDHDKWDLKMAVYAAMVERMDRNIGRLVAKLREQGRLDNTIFVFFSDNGASSGTHHYGATTREPPASGPGPMDSFHTYDTPWADASNTPLWGYKDTCFEGGIATSFLLHWPAGLKLPAGSIRHDVAHIIDLAPTFLAAAGVERPAVANGQPVPPLEGLSLLPLLREGVALPSRALFWEYNNDAAVRDGDWKLVRFETGPWELYNLATDRAEQNNLAAREPERAAQLAAAWDAWSRRLGIDKLPPKKRTTRDD